MQYALLSEILGITNHRQRKRKDASATEVDYLLSYYPLWDSQIFFIHTKTFSRRKKYWNAWVISLLAVIAAKYHIQVEAII